MGRTILYGSRWTKAISRSVVGILKILFFISDIFAAALSMIASAFNTLIASIYADFIENWLEFMECFSFL